MQLSSLVCALSTLAGVSAQGFSYPFNFTAAAEDFSSPPFQGQFINAYYGKFFIGKESSQLCGGSTNCTMNTRTVFQLPSADTSTLFLGITDVTSYVAPEQVFIHPNGHLAYKMSAEKLPKGSTTDGFVVDITGNHGIGNFNITGGWAACQVSKHVWQIFSYAKRPDCRFFYDAFTYPHAVTADNYETRKEV